jgi:hypothetical protein
LANAFSGQLPKRLVYGLVRNDAYNGTYELNPFNFQHCNVTQTAVYVNGKCHPTIPFAPVYTGDNKNWLREYRTLYDTMGIFHGDKSFGITIDEFPNGYCLYALDLTPNQKSWDGSTVNLIRKGDVRIDFQFGVDVPHAMTCLMFAEYDNLMEIDNDRNVILTYTAGK